MKAWKLICIVLVATITFALISTGNAAHLKNLKRRSVSSSSRSESTAFPASAIQDLSTLPLPDSLSKVGVNNTSSRSSENENNESSSDYSTLADVSTVSGSAVKNGNVLTALANAGYIWIYFVFIAYILF